MFFLSHCYRVSAIFFSSHFTSSFHTKDDLLRDCHVRRARPAGFESHSQVRTARLLGVRIVVNRSALHRWQLWY